VCVCVCVCVCVWVCVCVCVCLCVCVRVCVCVCVCGVQSHIQCSAFQAKAVCFGERIGRVFLLFKYALCAEVIRLRVSYHQNVGTLSLNSLRYLSNANLFKAVH